MRAIASLVGTFVWVMGIILANGFWSTFFAVIFPLWAWYLAVEHILLRYGVL